MNSKIYILLSILSLVLFLDSLFGIEKIVMQVSNAVEYTDLLDAHNVYFKWCTDLDLDGNKNFYFLDCQFGSVFVVESSTGKLVRTISTKGQGPGELAWPTSLRVKKDKVFVYDRGFNGIKIFSIDGKLLREFKVQNPGYGESIDVNEHEEIFVQSLNTSTDTILSVYNTEGKLLRNLVPANQSLSGDKSDLFKDSFFKFRLDGEGNIYILFPLQKRTLEKYNKEGKLVWSRPIENEILEKYKRDKMELKGNGKAIHFSTSIYNLEIIGQTKILVGHVDGAMVFDLQGNPIILLTTIPPKNFDTFRYFNKQLVNVSVMGKIVRIYKIDLEVKK